MCSFTSPPFELRMGIRANSPEIDADVQWAIPDVFIFFFSDSTNFTPMTTTSHDYGPGSFDFDPVELLVFPMFSLLGISAVTLLKADPCFSVVSSAPIGYPPSLGKYLGDRSAVLSSVNFPLMSVVPYGGGFTFSG